MAILIIARLTLREASRRRLLIAVAILTALVAVLSGWGFHRLLLLPCGSGAHPRLCSPSEIKLLAATLLILLMFMFSFVLALGAAFIGAPSIANDVESGVLLAILPRPIRRAEVVIGKWLGLAVLLALYAGIACGLEFVVAQISFSYVPPHPVLAILFLIGESLVVLTLSMLGSTRLPGMTTGIIVLILFGLTWMGGIAGAVGSSFHSQAIENVGTTTSLIMPTDGLWRGAIYELEPVSTILAQEGLGRIASGNPFFVTASATSSYVGWAAGWVIVLLAVSVWSFNRRQL